MPMPVASLQSMFKITTGYSMKCVCVYVCVCFLRREMGRNISAHQSCLLCIPTHAVRLSTMKYDGSVKAGSTHI